MEPENDPIYEPGGDAQCAYQALYERGGGPVPYTLIKANAGKPWATPEPNWLAGLAALVERDLAERSGDDRDYTASWWLTDQGAVLHDRFGVG